MKITVRNEGRKGNKKKGMKEEGKVRETDEGRREKNRKR